MSEDSYWHSLLEDQKIYRVKYIDLVEKPDDDRVMLRLSPNERASIETANQDSFVMFPSFDALYRMIGNVHEKLHRKIQGRQS